jgi:excisionase family DNA binding protein
MHARWLTVTQAAKRLGVTRAAVFQWVKSGKLPAAQSGKGSAILIREDDLEKYAAQKAKEKK